MFSNDHLIPFNIPYSLCDIYYVYENLMVPVMVIQNSLLVEWLVPFQAGFPPALFQALAGRTACHCNRKLIRLQKKKPASVPCEIHTVRQRTDFLGYSVSLRLPYESRRPFQVQFSNLINGQIRRFRDLLIVELTKSKQLLRNF